MLEAQSSKSIRYTYTWMEFRRRLTYVVLKGCMQKKFNLCLNDVFPRFPKLCETSLKEYFLYNPFKWKIVIQWRRIHKKYNRFERRNWNAMFWQHNSCDCMFDEEIISVRVQKYAPPTQSKSCSLIFALSWLLIMIKQKLHWYSPLNSEFISINNWKNHSQTPIFNAIWVFKSFR